MSTANRVVEEASQSSSIARFGKGKGFTPALAGARNRNVAVSDFPVPFMGGFGMKQEELLAKVDDALKELESALKNGKSETLSNYLSFLSRFHNYSFGNVMLIYLQNPEATLVAGYQKWKSMGRQVRKGEKGIRILAPLVRKKADVPEEATPDESEPKRVVTGFRGVSVFDVSQTDGDDLPELQSYFGDPAENLSRLMSFASANGIEVLMEAPSGGALGVSEGGAIRVRPDLSPAETFAVLVHEIAHELLHKGKRRAETTKVSRETEAEAVAFAVCSAIGLDSNGCAADYIQLYTGNSGLLRESLDVIRETASRILSVLERPVEPIAG